MNTSEQNFCDRIKNFREQLDLRYILASTLVHLKSALVDELDNRYLQKSDWVTLKSALINELDQRYAFKNGDTTPPDTLPPDEGDTDTDSDSDSDSDTIPPDTLPADAIIRITYDRTATVDYDTATINANANATKNYVTIDAAACNVPVSIATGQSKVISCGSAGGTITGGSNCTIYAGTGNDVIDWINGGYIANFGLSGSDSLYIGGEVNYPVIGASLSGNNLILYRTNSVNTNSPYTATLAANQGIPVTQIPKFGNNTVDGYFTYHGAVTGSTLTTFTKCLANENIDLNSTLYAGVCNVTIGNNPSDYSEKSYTITADSVNSGVMYLPFTDKHTVIHRGGNLYFNKQNPYKLDLSGDTVTGSSPIAGTNGYYSLQISRGSISLGGGDIQIKDSKTGGRYLTYHVASNTWGANYETRD